MTNTNGPLEPEPTSEAAAAPIDSSWEEKKKPRGRPFKVGNTRGKGRPKGSRNKTSALVKELLGAHTQEITETLIQLTKREHFGAVKLAMSILCPPQSGESVTWTMPPVKDGGDLIAAYSALAEALGNDELSPRQAQEFRSILDSMQLAFKNKFGPPIRHIIEWRVVPSPRSDPAEPQESPTTPDTSDEAA